MARTNSKYFEYAKNLNGSVSSPTPVKILIANSATVKLGQLARVNTAGLIVQADTSHAVLGRIVGFIDNYGTPVDAFMYPIAQTGHTNVASVAGINDTITTASNNATRAIAVYAEVEVATEGILYYNQSNGNLTQANLLQFFNLVSTADQVDQATASDSSGQVQLIQLDPLSAGDLTAGLFRVAIPQLMGQIGNSTALRVA